MQKITLFSGLFLLSACVAQAPYLPPLQLEPKNWSQEQSKDVETVDTNALTAWWMKFNDPVLDELVKRALKGSPDRLIAKAKIEEARGLRRSARSSLFPQISASGSTGREDTGSNAVPYPDSFYEAGFDASFEVDLFGRNRNNARASDLQLRASEAQYHDVSLTLVAEVVRSYIDFRAAQNQHRIAQKNLISQEKTLELIKDLHELGATPRLDVERAMNLVNTTRASLPEFERLSDNARLRLSVLSGDLPAILKPLLMGEAEIPGTEIAPVLMAPAEVLSVRPDVIAALANLEANTSLRKSATAELFPTFTLGGFYGIADNALVSSVQPWNIALGMAVSLLDFGRIEGRIDAAKAREVQAYHQYRKTILEAVTEVETALSDYANINQKRLSLKRAYENADKSLELSQTLYKEGEILFLDVLDAQRTVNNAESALISAKAQQAESLTRLYKSLGVY